MCHVQKIHRIGKSLFGFAGDVALAAIFLEWLQSKGRKREELHKQIPPDNRDDFIVLELAPSGLAYWNGWGSRVPLIDKTYAIGSGAPAALRAFRDGKSIDEAILGATELDEASGKLTAVQVEELRVKRKR